MVKDSKGTKRKRKGHNEYIEAIERNPRSILSVRNELSAIPGGKKCHVDDDSGLPFKPDFPLPSGLSNCICIIGPPGSGKTHFMSKLVFSGGKNRYLCGLYDNIHLISASHRTLGEECFYHKTKYPHGVPEDNVHDTMNDTTMLEIEKELFDAPNANNLIIMDDVIKYVNRSKVMGRVFMNRRHLTYNKEQTEDPNSEEHIQSLSEAKFQKKQKELLKEARKCSPFANDFTRVMQRYEENIKTRRDAPVIKHKRRKPVTGLSVIITTQKYKLLENEFRTMCSHYMIFRTTMAAERKAIREELMGDLNREEQDRVLQLAWEREDGDTHGFLYIRMNAPKEDRYFANFDRIVFK